jgi:hypothetical protein
MIVQLSYGTFLTDHFHKHQVLGCISVQALELENLCVCPCEFHCGVEWWV